jgi:hypothetical protein
MKYKCNCTFLQVKGPFVVMLVIFTEAIISELWINVN